MIPISFRIIGDRQAGMNFIGFGGSQMQILENDMNFQGLKQYSRQIVFADGTKIICSKNHGIRTVDILCSSESIQQDQQITSLLTVLNIIFGNAEEWRGYDPKTLPEFSSAEDVKCADEGYGSFVFRGDSRLYGSFVNCYPGTNNTITGNSSGATSPITDGQKLYFSRLYEPKEIFGASTLALSQYTELNYLLNTASAFDNPPVSNVAPDSRERIFNWWSKTFDELIIVTYTYLGENNYVPLLYWGYFVSFQGSTVASGNGFVRQCQIGDSWQYYRECHIGFDIWREKNTDGVYGDYMFGIIGDVEGKLSVYRVAELSGEVSLEFSYSCGYRDYKKHENGYFGAFERVYHGIPNEEDNADFVYLAGYGFDEDEKRHKIYSCAPNYGAEYYLESLEYDKESQSVKKTYSEHNAVKDLDSSCLNDGVIITVIWNPIKKTPSFIVNTDQRLSGSLEKVERNNFNYSVLRYGQLGENWCFFGDITGGYGCRPYFSAPMLYGYPPDIIIGSSGNQYIVPAFFSGWAVGSEPIFEKWMENYSFTDYIEASTYEQGIFGLTTPNNGQTKNLAKGRLITGSKLVYIGISNKVPNTGETATDGHYFNATTWFNYCDPEGAKEYRFKEGVFDAQGITYKYSEVPYEELIDCEDISGASTQYDSYCRMKCRTWGVHPACPGACADPNCSCIEYAWEEKESGREQLQQFTDPLYPHDHNWRSVLLHGNCRKDDDDFSGETKEVKNWVIYASINGTTLYVVDDNCNIIETFGATVRAFFKQQDIEMTT